MQLVQLVLAVLRPNKFNFEIVRSGKKKGSWNRGHQMPFIIQWQTTYLLIADSFKPTPEYPTKEVPNPPSPRAATSSSSWPICCHPFFDIARSTIEAFTSSFSLPWPPSLQPFSGLLHSLIYIFYSSPFQRSVSWSTS